MSNDGAATRLLFEFTLVLLVFFCLLVGGVVKDDDGGVLRVMEDTAAAADTAVGVFKSGMILVVCAGLMGFSVMPSPCSAFLCLVKASILPNLNS